MVPRHTPVTSTVTSVCSIQSGRAQPLANTKVMAMTPKAALMRLSLLGASPALLGVPWRGPLLRAPTEIHLDPVVDQIPRSSHLIAIHLEHYTYPPTAQAERVTVHRSLDWSRPDETAGAEVPYLPCHLCPLLLKDKHDLSSQNRSSHDLFSFPHAGHVNGYQRPVDPVLLRTATREHQGCSDDPQGSFHVCLYPRRNPSAPGGGPPEGQAAARPRLRAWVPTNSEAESSEVPTSATGGSVRKSCASVRQRAIGCR